MTHRVEETRRRSEIFMRFLTARLCARSSSPERLSRQRLKAKIDIELYATGRPRRDGQPEERRALIAYISYVIHAIERVECAEADFDRRSFVSLLPILRSFQIKLFRPAKIECRRARSFQTISAHSVRPVIGNRIVIVIESGRQAVWTPGSKRNRHPQIEPAPRL